MNNNLKLDRILNNLSSKKYEWVSVPIQKKIFYLQSAQDRLADKAQNWVQLCAAAKHIDSTSALSGQEWLAGPAVVMRQLGFLKTALKAGGSPKPNKISQNENGQYRVQVMPKDFSESILWHGFHAEIWVQKGKEPTQGRIYKESAQVTPTLSLILGAGNVSSIAPLDALHKLYAEGKVCLVKLNPVNDYLADILNEVFFDLIHDGFLSFVKGDGETGAELCKHSSVDEIHITGSHHTHDAIVWGNPGLDETKIRKAENKPLITKSITSELGCVTPTIIVPGTWTEKELKFQAKQIASGVENNASFNCNAMKVLVTSQNWPQRELFLNYLREELKSLPPRYAYYPGAWDRYQKFLNQYTQSEVLGEKKEGCIPWTFIPNIPTNNPSEYALQTEAFCGILSEISLPAEDAGRFMEKAADFCNNRIWGTLSCSIFVDPRTQEKYEKELKSSINSLRYGSIAVNCWSALSFAFGATIWGAYPGHTLQDIQSGIGFVQNGFMIDYPEKSVIYAPFSIRPKPAWFYDNQNMLHIGKKFVKYEYTKRFIDFFKLISSALKS